ncbi:DNA-processing protein DprA [Brevibacterium aurantiacum]|uniref:DNA processing protein DprA n=1 Tax=Brevibacterium aurantiacum TaxID=273384 RepID=A0A556CAM7_BREAU|nr:DNA-processing protein DprA [Brevibacterium aurantiacum]TSI14502.1 DNA processing protein DprA [Brevibacterium aurantiacum]
MTGIADLAPDERRARMLLSFLSEPDDATTARILAREGGVETIRLLEGDGTVLGLNRVDAQIWRNRLALPHRLEGVVAPMRGIEQPGVATMIPGDAHWPQALNELGDRAPHVLWARGSTSFLARSTADLVTVMGARAATTYGEQVANEIAGDLSRGERVMVAGGAYGIEGAAHRAALASGGDTIAVLANGVDRPYPAGHRELLDRIADVGLLVSEVPPGSVPTVTSSDPHMLLRNGTAQLVTDGSDVEELITQAPGHGADRAELGPEFTYRPVPSTDKPTRSM